MSFYEQYNVHIHEKMPHSSDVLFTITEKCQFDTSRGESKFGSVSDVAITEQLGSICHIFFI